MALQYNLLRQRKKVLSDKMQGKIDFGNGTQALQFLNNKKIQTLPYLQKDPRMCITLPTWLELLDDEPAVVFTYRHPLEVALSLKKRDRFSLEHGLKLWIIYNMRAIQSSIGLCRVFTTNVRILKDSIKEVQRIKDQLTDRCNVIPPAKHLITQSVVDSFIDPDLQHNSKERKNDEKTSPVLKDFGDGCIAKEFESDHEEGKFKFKAERELYLLAMQIFCDFEEGKAYGEHYDWPESWKLI